MQTLPPPVDQLAGKVLGNYTVKQLLGHGNVNAIYAAQQQPQGQTVMLTAFTMPETFSPEARERFFTRFTQVASKLVTLDHPSILPTYDFGTQFGYPYLITPFVTGGSLAKLLQQETQCTPEHVLQILKQVASGLDYAHQNGIVHGTLKPATILLDDEQNVHITGFGLATILKMRGIETSDSPYAHLVSIAGTFLGAAEYIAPEVVQGEPADTRSDVYAMGILLFELLTGKLPFSGEDPVAIAMQHVQQRVPSLQAFSPDVPPGLDLVVQRAVETDPSQRFQSVGKLAKAFERVLEVLHGATSPVEVTNETPSLPVEMTMPPTVNWDEELFTQENLPMTAKTLKGHLSTATNPRMEAGNWQLRPPIVTSQMAAIKATQRREVGRSENVSPNNAIPLGSLPQPVMETRGERKKGSDPFASWTSDSRSRAKAQEFGTFEPESRESSKGVPAKSKPTRKENRRRVVAMLATGVVAAGIVGAGGIGVTRFLQNGHAQQSNGSHPTTPVQAMTAQGGNATPKQKGTTGKQKPTTQVNQTKPAPAKKTRPATHTGVTIGLTSQAPNSAKDFKNPTDNADSLLVRLPDGTFSAYERACTHQQVPVNYDPVSKKFICPLHHSVFDPAQNGKVLQGPATLPLAPVKVSVNADGTVTVV